jgi:hypothetical protein
MYTGTWIRTWPRGWTSWCATKKVGLEGRLTDMNAMAGWGYFHPETRGKTSIKYTLPVALKEHRSPRIRAWLEHFGERASGPVSLWAVDGQEVPVNPYQLLPEGDTIEGYAVREGTGAMTAYKDMLYGELRTDPVRNAALAEALRLYCKLDTLAMVVIWEHCRGWWVLPHPFTTIPSSCSCSSSIRLGASIITSRPALFFGKAMNLPAGRQARGTVGLSIRSNS